MTKMMQCEEIYFHKSPYHPPMWLILDLNIPSYRGDRYILSKQVIDDDDRIPKVEYYPQSTHNSIILAIAEMVNLKINLIFYGFLEYFFWSKNKSDFLNSPIGKLLSKSMLKEIFDEIFNNDDLMEKIFPEFEAIYDEMGYVALNHFGTYTSRWSKKELEKISDLLADQKSHQLTNIPDYLLR